MTASSVARLSKASHTRDQQSLESSPAPKEQLPELTEVPSVTNALEIGMFFLLIIRIMRAFLIEEVKMIKKLATAEKSGKKKKRVNRKKK